VSKGVQRQELQGRVALVTGSGRNIGRAIAVALAQAGAAVAVNARESEQEIRLVASEINGFPVLADVADEASVQKMVSAVLAKYGRLDILVNNAAVRAVEPLEAIDAKRWREVTGVILDGAWFCARACLDALKKSEAGAIVNIGGLSAHTGATGRPHVIAAKAGLVGLTRALAHDLASYQITVNCVVPGLIETVRTSPSANHKKSPLGRRGKPEEVAAAVRFLVGPGARYITGQTVHVSGGAAA
jgi:3-oxoacyl-[acyl-carrier protein] reductase